MIKIKILLIEKSDNLNVQEQVNKRYEENIKRIEGFRLIDDIFFKKCFEENMEGVELLLQIILDKSDLKVSALHTQHFVTNLLNRSVQLDVVATDSQNKTYNVEIQRASKGAGAKRARYHSSILDTNLLKKNDDFEALPETYVIFICEEDVMGEGEALYEIGRCNMKNKKPFKDGSHIIYVNASYRDDSSLGKLMHDFYCTDPSDMYYKRLANQVEYFKKNKEGLKDMCKILEDMRKENMMEVASRLLDAGNVDTDLIAKCCDLSIEEVEELKKKKAS